MTNTELDFARSKLLVDNKPLAYIVTRGPAEYVFDGRANEHKLWRLQEQFHEARMTFLTTRNVQRMHELATQLPRLADMLRRAATGWRDRRGVVHRFALDNPELTKERMRAELEGAA